MNNYIALYHTHKTVVILFLLLYLVKTVLLFVNQDTLEKFTKITKIPEMIISFIFLATGLSMLYIWTEIRLFQWIKFSVIAVAIPLAVIGFKKKNKILATLSFLLIITAYGLAEMNKRRQNIEKTYDETATMTIMGKQLFNSNCIICHGDDGKLGQAGAKDLSISKLSKEEIVSIVTTGRNSMPPYKKYFTPEEIEAIADYVKTLRK